MSKGRAVPPQPRALEHAARRAALLSLDPARIRTWAARWGVPLIATDDAGLLERAHQAIVRDVGIPEAARLASLRWLAARGDAVAAEALMKELEAKKE